MSAWSRSPGWFLGAVKRPILQHEGLGCLFASSGGSGRAGLVRSVSRFEQFSSQSSRVSKLSFAPPTRRVRRGKGIAEISCSLPRMGFETVKLGGNSLLLDCLFAKRSGGHCISILSPLSRQPGVSYTCVEEVSGMDQGPYLASHLISLPYGAPHPSISDLSRVTSPGEEKLSLSGRVGISKHGFQTGPFAEYMPATPQIDRARINVFECFPQTPCYKGR